jgi:hypothetical protein
MRGCAWLTGIDRHALHASVCEQAGVAFEVLLEVKVQGPSAFSFSTLSGTFKLKVYHIT